MKKKSQTSEKSEKCHKLVKKGNKSMKKRQNMTNWWKKSKNLVKKKWQKITN